MVTQCPFSGVDKHGQILRSDAVKGIVAISEFHGFKCEWCMVLYLTFHSGIMEHVQFGKNWKQMVCKQAGQPSELR